MTQPKTSDTNCDNPINSVNQNLTNDFTINDNLFLSTSEEQRKCDYPSPHFFEHDSTRSQIISSQELSITSPSSSSPPILERQLSKECVKEQKSEIDNKNSLSPITFGLSFSSSTSINNQLHCIPTNVCSTVVTSVTTVTSVRRPRHKPAERRELLELAVNDVLGSQISMRRAAQKYNLAKSSLCDYVRKNGIILPNLRFKSYQTIPRSTATDLAVSSKKVTLSGNTNRQTSASCKRSGSPISGDTCISSMSPLPAKLSCGITRKVNITRTKNIDNNNKQHSKISARPVIQMDNLSLGVDNDRTVSLASNCDLNCIRSLISSEKTSIDSCPSEYCLSNQHHTNNQNNLFSVSNISKCFTNVISCKSSSRVESPWYNAAGLPTQVPMRSWTNTNTLSGSLQNINQQEQQTINMKNTSSFIPSSNSLFNNHLHSNVEDSLNNNLCLSKSKLNHSNDSITDCLHVANYLLSNETKSLNDEINNRQTDCCCPINSNSINITTNFPVDSPISQLSSEYDRRIFLNEESAKSWIFNNSNRNINGLSDSEQSRSILDSTQSLRSTNESSSTGVSYSPPNSTVNLDSSTNSRFLTTPLSLSSSSCQIFSDETTKLPFKTTHSSSDNTDHIGIQSESVSSNNTVTDRFLSNSTTASALCSFLGLNSINSHFCQPSASVFQSNLLPINQAAIAALLLQYSRAAVTTSTVSANSINSTISNYTNCPSVTSPLNSSQLQNPIDIVQNPLDHSNQIHKSFNQTTQSIPSIHLPFTTKNHYTNSELINSLNFCDQQINLLKQFPKFLIESNTGTVSSPTEFIIPSHLTNQSAAHSLRQLANTLFWSSLGSKAIDLLSTFGPSILQPSSSSSSAATAVASQEQRINSVNLSNSSSIHTSTTTITPTSIAVTKSGIKDFPINLLNNNNNNIDNQVNCCRNIESIKVHQPITSISTTNNPSTLLLNSDLLRNQLFLLHSTNSNMSHHVQGLINFINKSPTPFHVIQSVRTFLDNHGFRELFEEESWSLRPLDKVYITKNESTVIAAAVGGRFESGNGFTLLGAHTDSPCLRLKPNSERLKEGYIQLGVETYGGGLWYTWFDRDLKLAGRVIIRNAEGRLEQRLVHINNPIACVPSLAIHLNQEIKTQGFHPNSEQHLSPILCTSLMEQMVFHIVFSCTASKSNCSNCQYY
ncbi:unnamed protein product [Schistosoma margrebowiei]|uniref:Aspartyl aminopeptidase n=1 Tax=Schistosoma margrebowiei TaxID=48269 RepID=A0AA85A1M1_9TREM|nr:unnamed protein product [Schistosoma margrebowiei]